MPKIYVDYGKIVRLCMTHNELEAAKSFYLSKLEDPEYNEIKEDLNKLILKVYSAYMDIYLKTNEETRDLAITCGFTLKQYK